MAVSQQRLHEAGSVIWGRSRDHQQSSTVADLFTEAGLEHDPDLLSAYYDFWEPHTYTDPEVRPTWEALRAAGIKVGVLSNTIWPRAFHEGIFERDGVLDLVDGDVYTSEIPWTKPSPHAFQAAAEAVGVTDPARCVYVGDRLFDDIWGAKHAGMHAIHVPHSEIPASRSATARGLRTRWCSGSARSRTWSAAGERSPCEQLLQEPAMRDCAVRPTSPSCGPSARVVLGTTEKGSNASRPFVQRSAYSPAPGNISGVPRSPSSRTAASFRAPTAHARRSAVVLATAAAYTSAQARSSARAALATPSAVSSPAGTSYAVAPATGVTPSAASWPVSRSRRRAVGVVRRRGSRGAGRAPRTATSGRRTRRSR